LVDDAAVFGAKKMAMYLPLPFEVKGNRNKNPKDETIMNMIEDLMVKNGGHSVASAQRNIKGKLEHRTLAYMCNVERNSTTTSKMKSSVAPKKRNNCSLKMSNKNIKRRVKDDDWLDKTKWEQSQVLANCWVDYAEEACNGSTAQKRTQQIAQLSLLGANVKVETSKHPKMVQLLDYFFSCTSKNFTPPPYWQ
jgi:predicted RNase H-like nuclease (RuvC/YqgF family)